MVKNYYYLIAGILAFVFSVTHALNGQNTVLPALNVNAITADTRKTFVYVWHIISAENMLFGLAFFLMAVQKKLSKVRFAAWLIAALLVIRWIIIFGATFFYNAPFKNILVDSFAIFIYVFIIIMGTRVKDKTSYA
jgi:hypothetical protein